MTQLPEPSDEKEVERKGSLQIHVPLGAALLTCFGVCRHPPHVFLSRLRGARLPPTHVYIHTYSNPLRTQLSTCLFRSKTKSTKMVKWENSETGRGDGSYAYSSVCIQKRGNRKNTPRRGTTSKGDGIRGNQLPPLLCLRELFEFEG